MNDFLKDIIKETGNEYASLVADGVDGDTDTFIDTGSYIFNTIGGSIYSGLPSNKITAINGGCDWQDLFLWVWSKTF